MQGEGRGRHGGGIFRALGRPVKVYEAARATRAADGPPGVGGRRREAPSRPTGSGGIGAAERAQRASSGRAPRSGRPAPRGAEPADGVWGHRSSAARVAREQRTGPQECLCYGTGMDDSLLESLDAGVLTLTLNRPARRNALDEALITRLHRRLAAAGEDGAVRTVVLTGAGGAFSSGADLKEAATALTGDLIERAYNPAIRAIRRMPKPVIAAVDGVATGYGASLALAADIRLASERARLALIFARVGLTLDGGASWFLPRLVGLRAYELAMTGDLIDAAEGTGSAS
ncbi:MAG: enoyl-CoA hydratase/isomerase family protein [Deltaproteobacteria bacterium]|nr:MAG: enoyl-CoA hydratase/isomerase family protein [Deltaproteobacteria bacterium]